MSASVIHDRVEPPASPGMVRYDGRNDVADVGCRFVTHAGNARSLSLRSLEIMINGSRGGVCWFSGRGRQL